ncbi:A disintegrin and metalloproteinase with thrombospondin motifs 7-like [Babylonia areolata]|uniref:A disintegrin and metalloproteinase with thrombospondin motifs 7-like n=1 Tax=Babylonia areolata TaxID=304850 RepID=UPI003FD29585
MVPALSTGGGVESVSCGMMYPGYPRSAALVIGVVVLVMVCWAPAGHCGVTEAERHRHVREVTQYWLDILVLVDKSAFQAWYDRTPTSLSVNDRRSQALADLKRYFTLVISEVSALYSDVGSDFRVNFRPVGFHVQTEGAEEWVLTSASGQSNAELTLTTVTRWLQDNVQSSTYDHALLFTGTDLATDNEGHTTGRGTVGTMCKGQSVSVIEDRGAFQSVFTAAHELGHSLNASHDGQNNACSTQTRYIMAARSGDVTDANRRQPWFFSTCSRNQMVTFLNSLSPEGNNCLRNSLPQNSVPNVTGMVPGQLYGSDRQCQHLYGPQSSFCFFDDLNTICSQMPCSNPATSDSGRCDIRLAATGTSCGHKKWCQRGQCVQSSDAPDMESCVGDQTVRVNGLTCPQMARIQPALCYDLEVFTKCCHSCQNIQSDVRGCPFGDWKSGCSRDVCHKVLTNGEVLDADCCHTCNFSPNNWTCHDADSVDGVSCATAVRRNAHQGCYNLTLAFHCCATCQSLRDVKRGAGCEYGDRVLQGCVNRGESCDVALCCLTCSTNTTDTGCRQRPLSFVPLLLLSLLPLSSPQRAL